MWQSPFGIIGGFGLGIGPITDEQWGTRWYGQGFAADVFPLEDAPLSWQESYPDLLVPNRAVAARAALTTWTTAWPSVVPAPPAAPDLVSQPTATPVRAARRAQPQTLAEDLNWDLIALASARYPSQFPQPSRIGQRGGAILDPAPLAAAPAVPSVASWGGHALPASGAAVSTPLTYQAWSGPVSTPPEGVPERSWAGWQPDRLDRVVGRTAGTGLVDPLPRGTVRLEWQGVERPFLRRVVRALPGGAAAPDPTPVAAGVTEWRPILPSLLARGARPQAAGQTIQDPTPIAAAPGTPPFSTGQYPDQLVRRPGPSTALLTKGTTGAAGFDLSTTARPGFGGQQIPGWRTIQYTGLIGSLFVAGTPTLLALRAPDGPRRIRSTPGLTTVGPVDPITPVAPAPDRSWAGEYPAWVARRALPVAARPTTTAPTAPPVVAPDRSWAGEYPAQIARRTLPVAARPWLGLDPFPRPPVAAPPIPFLTDTTGGVPIAQESFLYQAWATPVTPTNLPPAPLGVSASRVDLTLGTWTFNYQGWAGPIKPATDPVSPTAPFSLFPATSLPTRRREAARLGGAVAPLRVADTTAVAPTLSWDGTQPDWIARRRSPAVGWTASSLASVIPFLDPSRFGWRGVGADWLVRRRAQATPAGLLETPVQYPIPETSWRGQQPGLVWGARRIRANGETVWEPNARPNDPSPDLAWRGEQPDQVRAPRRVIDRLWHVQAPRMTPFVPDLVGGLVSAPDRLDRRTPPAATQRTWADRFEIVIPDLRRDWAPSYPDQTRRAARVPTLPILTLPEADRAVSPLDWYTNEQDRRPFQVVRAPHPSATLVLPGGALTTTAEQLGWAQPQSLRRMDRPTPTEPRTTVVVPPALVAEALGCVEIIPVWLTSPGLVGGVLTTPELIDGAGVSPAVGDGEVC